MAKKQVTYRVLAPCFVNGSFQDPKGRKDMTVVADEGLAGSALEEVKSKPTADPTKDPPPQ